MAGEFGARAGLGAWRRRRRRGIWRARRSPHRRLARARARGAARVRPSVHIEAPRGRPPLPSAARLTHGCPLHGAAAAGARRCVVASSMGARARAAPPRGPSARRAPPIKCSPLPSSPPHLRGGPVGGRDGGGQQQRRGEEVGARHAAGGRGDLKAHARRGVPGRDCSGQGAQGRGVLCWVLLLQSEQKTLCGKGGARGDG